MKRPYILSVAGFDPSGGAGVLSDIKTFETLKSYGLAVCTAITFQNESEFDGLKWTPLSSIHRQLDMLFRKYSVEVFKIGLIESFAVLNSVIDQIIGRYPNAKIIWDPILSASAGFNFHSELDNAMLESILRKLYLITPNIPEAIDLSGEDGADAGAIQLSHYCPVFLKGGHSATNSSNDILFEGGQSFVFQGLKVKNGLKHGSGCILSSAIASYLAQGRSLKTACHEAKEYTRRYLVSSDSLLGYHTMLDKI